MFEELFTTSKVIERYQAAPFAEERLSYLRHRAESGTRRGTLQAIAVDQLRLLRLVDLSEGDMVSVSRVEAASGEWPRLANYRYYRPASPKHKAAFVDHAVQWLHFLGWLDEPVEVRHPHTAEVVAYEAWMRRERGLSEETICNRCRAADEFFDWLAANDIALGSVKSSDIDSAIAAKNACGRCARASINVYARSPRAFFRFAEDRCWCTPDMAATIMPPRIYPNETVPAGPSREDFLRLLATTEGDRPADKRDRAILMLFAAYGLRSGEVRGLQLDDLDWENETLRVRRSKPGRTHLYPLARGVGQAILRYILEVRPSRLERTLFFTLTAPTRPLSRGGMGSIVRNRLRRIGIVAGRRGPHALRHATAQHLLDQGMSMKVIGDFLGHRDPSSTAVYAKVSLNALREVADFDLEGLA